jgi:hypothetical protein
MDWLKLNSMGILRGSLSNADNVTQLIWIKILAMANETRDRDGYLRYREGKPYSNEYIAQVCNVTIGELITAFDDFMDDVRDGKPRIEYAEDNSIHLTNWAKYQNKPNKAEEELNPRLLKSATELEAIQRKLDNKNPKVSIDVLSHDFGHNVVTKDGEILNKVGNENG